MMARGSRSVNHDAPVILPGAAERTHYLACHAATRGAVSGGGGRRAVGRGGQTAPSTADGRAPSRSWLPRAGVLYRSALERIGYERLPIATTRGKDRRDRGHSL